MADVLGGARWGVVRGDCLEWLSGLPDGCVDLLLTSPPYVAARLYLESGEDLGIARDAEEWVAWLLRVCEEARRVCKGLCAFVVEGQTSNYRYDCAPALLMADLHRKGFHLRKPCVYRRVGIPGSGGPDYLRNDWEFVVCFGPGGKLPWSDNTALGHPPKWAPGGEMSHRLSSGQRVNQWGSVAGKDSKPHGGRGRKKDGSKGDTESPPHQFTTVGATDEEGVDLFGLPPEQPTPPKNHLGVATGRPIGTRKRGDRGKNPEGENYRAKNVKRGATRGYKDGDTDNGGVYEPPVLANPGNVVREKYDAAEVARLLGEVTDVVDCKAGGNQMGSKLCHFNEAPFSEELATFFIRSFCPPGGITLDPFCGSGTTLATALRWGRRALGCDLRASQVDLTRRRIEGETPLLFT